MSMVLRTHAATAASALADLQHNLARFRRSTPWPLLGAVHLVHRGGGWLAHVHAIAICSEPIRAVARAACAAWRAAGGNRRAHVEEVRSVEKAVNYAVDGATRAPGAAKELTAWIAVTRSARLTLVWRGRCTKKRDIVSATSDNAELGALLRREGLYSSHLSKWRQEAERARVAGLEPKKRGPQPKAKDSRDTKIAEQERQIAKLTRRAERAEALVALRGGVSEILGIALPTPDEDER
jgi:hypothetical protein